MISLPDLLTSANLPTIPAIPLKLIDVRNDPDSSLNDFTEVIRNDPAICSRLITLANSSAFPTRFEINTIDRAVQLLGPPIVIGTAFSVTLSENSFKNPEQKTHFDDYWTQSLVQAIAAKSLGTHLGENTGGDHFLNGLLLDVGRLALLNVAPEQYIPVLDKFAETREPLVELEQQTLGPDHVQIGGELMKQWGFPQEMVTILLAHHQPASSLNSHKGSLIAALSSLVGDYFCTSRRVAAFLELKQETKTILGFEQEQLEELLSQISLQIAEVGDIFNLPPGTNLSAADLLNRVNQELAGLMANEVQAQSSMASRQAAREQEISLLSEKLNHDSLTGLYNRRYMQEHLDKVIRLSSRTGSSVGLLFLDIDRFKKINDTYGHSFGDEILRNVARKLQESLYADQILARFGGEEFVVILEEASESSLQNLGEKLRTLIEQSEFQFNGRSVPITLSVGATLAVADRTSSHLAERMLAAADTAIYNAKHSGRNCFRMQSLLEPPERAIDQGLNRLRFSRWLLDKKVVEAKSLLPLIQNLTPPSPVLGKLALQHKLLTGSQIQTILEQQKTTNKHFGNIALQLGLLSIEQVIELLALQKENPNEIAAELVRKFILTPHEACDLLQEFQKQLQFLKLSPDSSV